MLTQGHVDIIDDLARTHGNNLWKDFHEKITIHKLNYSSSISLLVGTIGKVAADWIDSVSDLTKYSKAPLGIHEVKDLVFKSIEKFIRDREK